jgi:hypothetical protein
MQLRIGLVGQPKRRRGGICRACEQFELSIVFRRARDLCSREYREWYIISTEIGFELPLAGLSFPEKLRWYDDRLSIHGRVLP